jgi:integrase
MPGAILPALFRTSPSEKSWAKYTCRPPRGVCTVAVGGIACLSHSADHAPRPSGSTSMTRSPLGLPVAIATIYRRAVRLGDVATNPVSGVSLPAAPGRRDRVASPAEAAMLIAAVRPSDQALWGTAFYAGLRLGELRALKWSDVDLEHGVIRVERALDQKGATIAPKSHAGTRTVPVPAVLRKLLAAHRLLSVGEGYVFGSSLLTPFTATAVHRRARLRWSKVEPKPLTPIGLHEARHTFASMAIAAGVNAKALTTYMGHASIQVTFDRYGHLMPGSQDEAASLLDSYLETRSPA